MGHSANTLRHWLRLPASDVLAMTVLGHHCSRAVIGPLVNCSLALEPGLAETLIYLDWAGDAVATCFCAGPYRDSAISRSPGKVSLKFCGSPITGATSAPHDVQEIVSSMNVSVFLGSVFA